MKSKLTLITALGLMVGALLSGCSQQGDMTSPPDTSVTTNAPATNAPATNAPDTNTP